MNYRQKILHIRGQYLKGRISLETARGTILPLLSKMNERGEIIAKAHGQKFRPLTFGYVFR